MISVVSSSAEGRGFDPRPGLTKDIKFAASPLSMQHLAVRAKTGWPRVMVSSHGLVMSIENLFENVPKTVVVSTRQQLAKRIENVSANTHYPKRFQLTFSQMRIK